MKRNLILLLIITAAVFGCSKKSDTPSADASKKRISMERNYLTDQEKKFLADFSAFAANFKQKHANSFMQTSSMQARFSFRRLFRIVGADILGAAGGAVLGAIIGGGPGAVGGALVSGVSSSFLAGDPAQSQSVRNFQTLALDTLTYRFNDENPLDIVGNGHNEGLDSLRNNSDTSTLSDADIYNNIQSYVVQNYSGAATMPTYQQYQQAATTNSTVQVLIQLNDPLTPEIINSLDSNEALSLFYRELFKIIFTYGMDMNDYAAIAEFFYEGEGIIATSEIDELDKMVLYAAFSTGRASANYWFDVDQGNR